MSSADISARLDAIERRIEALENATKDTTAAENDDLVLAKVEEYNKALMATVEQSVMDKIQTVVMPVLQKTAEFINYRTEDGEELVDHYRREVAKSSFGLIDGQLAIEGTVKDCRRLAPYVQTLYADNSEPSDSD